MARDFLDHLKNRKRSRVVVLLAVGFFYVLFLVNSSILVTRNLKNQQNDQVVQPIAYNSEVKGVATEPTPTSTPTPQPTIKPTLTPTPTPRPIKTLYKVAIFGDSMVDTMGQTLEYVEDSLKKKYPSINFGLYNYGQGSINVEQGIEKFSQQFSYSSRLFEPLPQLQADIIIIGSFAYNPLVPYDRDKHWLALTRLIDEAEKTSAKIYLLAEIAPLRADFGRGPNGVNWSTQTRIAHSGQIVDQLENAASLAKIKNIPLINVFEKTFNKKKREGYSDFISSSDGIHPSMKGHKVTADLIAETIRLE